MISSFEKIVKEYNCLSEANDHKETDINWNQGTSILGTNT